MPDKIKSEIVRIDLADASYKDTHAYIEPTYVNFFLEITVLENRQ